MGAETEIEREDQAWTEVLARWQEDAAHRAFLDRCLDLEALARAGARYRDVLRERPDDAPALRGREEVIRRATVAGLASLPRTGTVPRVPAWVRPALITVLAAISAGAGLLLLRSLASWGRP